MSADTSLFAVPEPNPDSKTGDPESPVKAIEGATEREVPQTSGNVEDENSHSESHSNKSNEANEIASKTTISERKLAANRQNATRSCGPKTEQGKANSSKNAIKHGIYAAKLITHLNQGANERLEYEELGAQLANHYEPIGFKEQLLVQQIFTELVRTALILKYEQRVLSHDGAFMGPALEKVLRYSSCHSRQLSRLLEELEDEQAKRRS